MKRIFIGLALLAHCFLAFSNDSIHLKLIDTEKSVFMISSSLYQYSLESGGKKNRQRISQSITDLEDNITSLKSNSLSINDSNLGGVINSLEDFSLLSSIVANESFATPESFYSGDFKRSESTVMSQLRALQNQLPPVRKTDSIMLKELDSINTELLSEYLYLCENNLSNKIFAPASDLDAISSGIDDFNSILKKLKESELAKRRIEGLTKVEKRWKYFSKYLTKHNDNAVPFVISRFSASLSKALSGIDVSR